MAHLHGTDSGVMIMKKHLSLIIKSSMVLFLVLYLTLLYTSDTAGNIPMDSIAQSMESDTTITLLKKRGRTDLKRYYQIDERDTDGFLFYKAESPMAVEEFCVIRAKNKAQAEAFLESAANHLSAQKKVFEGYGTDQMALLREAVVEKKGNYVCYICGADADDWRKSFLLLI